MNESVIEKLILEGEGLKRDCAHFSSALDVHVFVLCLL